MMRFLNKLYANLFGYFWLPCPICGRMFGGHEKHGDPSLLLEVDGNFCRSKCICKHCGKKAEELNRKFINNLPVKPEWLFAKPL